MPSRVLLVVVLVLFGLPLFIGLGRTDMTNDEAIYSYSVERMLALHDWVTPRAIYDGADNPFLEKPPLKTWTVAVGQLAGLPHDEFGLRFFDPLFAVAAFAYVFSIGRRLAGPLCGGVALLVLATFHPLVFEHGIRTNNMEAALLLTYCGGVYHFFRWTENDESRRGQAWAVAGFFAFGFLMKFVAALFLPIIAAIALLWRRDAAATMRTRTREWIWPATGAFAAIAPWFLVQTAMRGRAFWNEILGHQVVTRFTSALDPNHLRPWHFYFTETWAAFLDSGALVIAAAGVAWLGICAWKRRPWLARLLFVWWIVPYVLISVGTSKLLHYSYPFVPPIALGAGLAAARWLDLSNDIGRRVTRPPLISAVRNHRSVEYALCAIAVALFAVAAWTAYTGPFTWRLFGIRLLRSTSVVRPAVLGLVALALLASLRATVQVIAITVLVIALPVPAYVAEIPQFAETNRPLHAIRDCAMVQLTTHAAHRGGVYGPPWIVAGHSLFYYLHWLGPYQSTAPNPDQEIHARLFEERMQTPVVLPRPRAASPSDSADPGATEWRLLPAVDLGTYVIALPGPYAPCTAAAIAEGGRTYRFDTVPR